MWESYNVEVRYGAFPDQLHARRQGDTSQKKPGRTSQQAVGGEELSQIQHSDQIEARAARLYAKHAKRAMRSEAQGAQIQRSGSSGNDDTQRRRDRRGRHGEHRDRHGEVRRRRRQHSPEAMHFRSRSPRVGRGSGHQTLDYSEYSDMDAQPAEPRRATESHTAHETSKVYRRFSDTAVPRRGTESHTTADTSKDVYRRFSDTAQSQQSRRGTGFHTAQEPPTLTETAEPRRETGFHTAEEAPAQGVLPILAEEPGGGRQVGVRGCWAEFAIPDEHSYWVNIVTGEMTWARPASYDSAVRTGAAINRDTRESQNQVTSSHSNIFVGSLPIGILEDQFQQIFTQFGTIIAYKMIPGTRYGFVKYATIGQAQLAIDKMHGAMLYGAQIQCKFAKVDKF